MRKVVNVESFVACFELDTLGHMIRDLKKLRSEETDGPSITHYNELIMGVKAMIDEKA